MFNAYTNDSIMALRRTYNFHIEYSDLESEEGWVYDGDYNTTYVNEKNKDDEVRVLYIVAHEWMHLIQMWDGELEELRKTPSGCPANYAYAATNAAEEQAEAFALCLFPQYITTNNREGLDFINEGFGISLESLRWLLEWRDIFEKRWPELGFPQARQLAFSLGASFEQVSHLALI